MNKSVKVVEGLWFAVPLRDGGYGAGLTARVEPSRGVSTIFCYFFPQRWDSPPNIERLTGLCAGKACWVTRTSSKDIRGGNWPVIGCHVHWDKSEWPMPSFIRQDVVSKKYRKTTYDAENPAVIISEGLCPPGEELLLPEDGLNGGGAVEIKLTHLIKSFELEGKKNE